MFLREAVDAGDGGAHAAVALAHVLAEDARDERMNGRTAKASSASGQLMRSMMMTMKASTKTSSKIARTPEVNISLRASTSEVTRVTSRADGVMVEEAEMHALQMAEDLAAQVEHDLLAGPLHQVGLDKFEDVGNQQRAEVEQASLGDAGHRLAG